MNTTLQHPAQAISNVNNTQTGLWTKFIRWANGQESNRMLWLAIALVGHGCVLTIITMFAIMFAGNNFIFWPFAIGAMSMCLIVNLAAMPTKITIPVFFLSVLIDLAIIAICIANGFNISYVYNG